MRAASDQSDTGAMTPPPPADPGAFLQAAGLVVDEVSPTRVVGHLELGPDHHTPWGIVHGGVYATAIETAATIGASTAVQDRGMVAVGLTNTTQFLRSLAEGTLLVEAVALHQGRTQQLWQVGLADDGTRLVAHGELRLQNIEMPDRPRLLNRELGVTSGRSPSRRGSA